MNRKRPNPYAGGNQQGNMMQRRRMMDNYDEYDDGMTMMPEGRLLELLQAERRLKRMAMMNQGGGGGRGGGGGMQGRNRGGGYGGGWDDGGYGGGGYDDGYGYDDSYGSGYNDYGNRGNYNSYGDGGYYGNQRGRGGGGGGYGGGNRGGRGNFRGNSRGGDWHQRGGQRGGRGRGRGGNRPPSTKGYRGGVNRGKDDTTFVKRTEFPQIPSDDMSSDQVISKMAEIKTIFIDKAKLEPEHLNRTINEFEETLQRKKMYGSTVMYKDFDDDDFVCELYIGPFLIAIRRSSKSRSDARTEAFKGAIEKLKEKEMKDCFDFEYNINLARDRSIESVFSYSYIRYSNLPYLATIREDMEPRPLSDLVIMRKEKISNDRRGESDAEVVKTSCDQSDLYVEFLFTRETVGKNWCKVYVEKKLIAKAFDSTNAGAKAKASREALSKLTNKLYTIERRFFKLGYVNDIVKASKEDLKQNKEKYMADQTLFRESLVLRMKGETLDKDDCPEIPVITVSDLFIDEIPKFRPVEEEKKTDSDKKANGKSETETAETTVNAETTDKDETAEEKTESTEEKTETTEVKAETTEKAETPVKKQNFTEVARQRLKLLLDTYDDPDKYGHMLFSFEFPTFVRAELRTLHPELEYIATCKLVGGSNEQVHLIRSRKKAKKMVEMLKEVGKHPSFTLKEPASLIEEGTDGDLVIEEEKKEEEKKEEEVETKEEETEEEEKKEEEEEEETV